MSGNSLIASLRNRIQGTTEPAPAPAPVPEERETAKQLDMFEKEHITHVVVGDEPTPAPAPAPAINPPESELPPAPLPEKASAEDEKPKKRGRPAGSKNKPKDETKDAPVETSEVTVNESPVEPKVNVERESPVKSLDEGFTLYVDCIPDGSFVEYADRLVDAANAIIVKAQEATDEKVAHYTFLSYGKGKGALALALEDVLDEQKPVSVFCSSASDALPTLTKCAARIVRSVR